MGKKFFIIGLFISLFLINNTAKATSGACSTHFGVNCSIGADWDGSVICNDGWRDSDTEYNDTELCQYIKEPQTLEGLFADTAIKLTSLVLQIYHSYQDYELAVLENTSTYFLKLLKLASTEGISENEIKEAYQAGNVDAKNSIRNARSNKIALINDAKNNLIGMKNGYSNLDVNIAFINATYSDVMTIIDGMVNGINSSNGESDIENYYEIFAIEVAKYIINESENIDNSDEKNVRITFNDIGLTHPNHNAIQYLKDNNIINGYPDGSFKAENTVNRAELMKILIGNNYDTIGYGNCFKDVKSEWFAPYVCLAKSRGWVQGYADGTFKPAQTINRAEAIKMAIEVFEINLPLSISTNPYPDTNKGQWFAPYVFISAQKGLFDSDMNSYRPSEGMKRGEISEIIYRLLTIKKLQIEKYSKTLDDQMTSDY